MITALITAVKQTRRIMVVKNFQASGDFFFPLKMYIRPIVGKRTKERIKVEETVNVWL